MLLVNCNTSVLNAKREVRELIKQDGRAGRQPISEGFTSTVNQPVVVEAVGGDKRGKLPSVPLIFDHLWWSFLELLLVNTDMTNPAETGACQIENVYKSITKMTCFI